MTDLLFDSLTLQQQEIITSILDDDSKSGKNPHWVIVTGGPGTGKSHVLRALRQILSQRQLKYAVLAPTNIAAQNVEGTTIHRQIGGGGSLIDLISVMDHDQELKNLWSSDDIEYVTQRVREFIDKYNTDLSYPVAKRKGNKPEDSFLIIDECSMVSLPLFYTLLATLDCPSTTRIVLFGDAFQLDPISKIKRNLYDLFGSASSNGEIACRFHLTENIRQKDNQYFKKFIQDWWNKSRTGDETKHIKFGGTETEFAKLPMPKIVLCGKKVTMRDSNSVVLATVPGEAITITAIVQNFAKENDLGAVTKLSCLPPKLVLKSNVPIIMVKTCDSLYSNTICMFCKFELINDEKYALVKDGDGKEHRVPRYEDTIKYYNKNTNRMEAFGTVVQYPFDVFFAVTAHRIQGTTIHYPILVKYASFWDKETKQAYVATSRVTRPELVYYDINPLTIPLTLQKTK